MCLPVFRNACSVENIYLRVSGSVHPFLDSYNREWTLNNRTEFIIFTSDQCLSNVILQFLTSSVIHLRFHNSKR